MNIGHDLPEQPAGPEPLDPPDDAHHFRSEPARAKIGKRLIMIMVAIAAFLGAIGAGGYLAKRAWTSHMAGKAEQNRLERVKKAEPSRRGKTFEPEPASPPPPAPSALPEGFRQSGPRQPAAPVSPIPLDSKTGAIPAPPGSAQTTARPTPRPSPASMMLPDVSPPDAAQVSANPPSPPSTPPPAAAASEPEASAPSKRTDDKAPNVQDYARVQARKSPPTSAGQATAAKLGDRSLLLAKGAYVPCVLETDLNSNVPGPTSCVVTGNIYSDDGKVVLIDKGSRVLGEYKATLRPGDQRIAVLWNRIHTPIGVVVDVDSPAASGTGAAGVVGDVDNHWWQRVGAAFLLSFVQDFVTAKANENQAGNRTVINTASTSKNMSEKVLESTINIPPTLIRNRGERLMILVNRDLWFDSVYSVGMHK